MLIQNLNSDFKDARVQCLIIKEKYDEKTDTDIIVCSYVDRVRRGGQSDKFLPSDQYGRGGCHDFIYFRGNQLAELEWL